MKKRKIIYTTTGLIVLILTTWSVSKKQSLVQEQVKTKREISPEKLTKTPSQGSLQLNTLIVKKNADPAMFTRIKNDNKKVSKTLVKPLPVKSINHLPDAHLKKPAIKKNKIQLKPFNTNNLTKQEFAIQPERDTIIKGLKGIQLALPKGIFVDEKGDKIVGEIKIELKEAIDMEDIVMAGLTTKSDSKTLESGGMFYLNASANGENLKVAKGKYYIAKVPLKNNKKLNGMQFYGGEIDKGIVNWKNPVGLTSGRKVENFNAKNKLSEVGTRNNCECLPPGEINLFKEDKQVGYLLRSEHMGWANIDRLMNESASKPIDFITTVENKEELEDLSISMVFRSKRIFLPGYKTKSGTYSFTHGDYEKTVLPVGAKAYIIAVAYKNKESYFCMQQVVIKDKETVRLQLAETSSADIEKIIRKTL